MQNLDDLVSQAESIATNLEDDEVPHIHRNIEQLRRRGETFYNRAAQNDVKAAKLLGNKVGYELSAGLSKTLESLNVMSSYDGLSTINIEDIPSFLKNERETAILSSINLTRTNTLNMSYKLCEQSKNDWWNREKANILNVLVNSDKLSNLMPFAMNKSMANCGGGENMGGIGRTVMSREEMQYAREMSRYVDNVLLQQPIGSRRSLSEVLLQSDGSPMCIVNDATVSGGGNDELSEIGRVIERYCECRNRYGGGPQSIPMTSLADMRENESSPLSRAMVDGALAHLQSEYCSYARQLVEGLQRQHRQYRGRYMTNSGNINASDIVNGDGMIEGASWRAVMGQFVQHDLIPQLVDNHNNHHDGGDAPQARNGDHTHGQQYNHQQQPPPQILEDQVVDGVAVWPLIYACMRGGLWHEAVAVARQAASNIGDVASLLQMWIDNGAGDNAMAGDHFGGGGGPLPQEHARKLATEYKRHVRASPDACKRLVYCLLSGIAASDGSAGDDEGASAAIMHHRSVLATVDDFLWWRLTLVRQSSMLHATTNTSINTSSHQYQQYQHQQATLPQLQRIITEQYGESHFQASHQPLTYCRILLVCQLFETAIAFLARFEHLRCHAVHLALLLWHNNLLLVATDCPIDAPLLSASTNSSDGSSDLAHGSLPRLNLARLVALYTRKFEAAHPRDALDLFFMLRDLRYVVTVDRSLSSSVAVGADHHTDGDCDGGRLMNNVDDGQSMMDGFVACASSMAVEHGQLELLFGTVASDGGNDVGTGGSHHRPGLLTRYGVAVGASVLQAVSHRLRHCGRVEAACDALQLAGRYQEAAIDLAELLVGCVTMLPGNHPDVTRLQAKAEFVLARSPSITQEAAMLACVLAVARFVFLAGDIGTGSSSNSIDQSRGTTTNDAEAALAALDCTQLVPISADDGNIRSATEAFRNLPELVRSLFPGLLVAAMRTLRAVAKARHNESSSTGGSDVHRRAAALITFTGQLPYRMPSEVYASLSQLGLDFN